MYPIISGPDIKYPELRVIDVFGLWREEYKIVIRSLADRISNIQNSVLLLYSDYTVYVTSTKLLSETCRLTTKIWVLG